MNRHWLRVGAAVASFVLAPGLFADVIQTNPFLPPAAGVYSLPDACISIVCLENVTIGGFQVTNTSIVGGNESQGRTRS